MSKAFRPTICVDFDGVIHSYERGWHGGEIYGTATKGWWHWAKSVQSAGMDLVIYSSRSKTPEGINAMRSWLVQQWLAYCAEGAWEAFADSEGPEHLKLKHSEDDFVLHLAFASQKPAAWLTIDDRAIRFDGRWDNPFLSAEALLKFKAWNQLGMGG